MKWHKAACAAVCLAAGAMTQPALALSLVSDSGRTTHVTASTSSASILPGSPGALAKAAAPSGVEPNSIIGKTRRGKPKDDRIKFDASKPYPYPLSAVAYIEYSIGRNKARCTGFLIGPKTLLTAGSCVARGGSKSFYAQSSYRIYPGLRGTNWDWKRGRCKSALKATELLAVTAWWEKGAEDYNLGIIKLDCPVGADVGVIGLHATPNALVNLPIGLGGYPTDKGNQNKFHWASVDKVRANTTGQLYYNNDTSRGEIGAPVASLIKGCGPKGKTAPCALAIHAYDQHGKDLHRQHNHGTRMTRELLGLINSVRE